MDFNCLELTLSFVFFPSLLEASVFVLRQLVRLVVFVVVLQAVVVEHLVVPVFLPLLIFRLLLFLLLLQILVKHPKVPIDAILQASTGYLVGSVLQFVHIGGGTRF